MASASDSKPASNDKQPIQCFDTDDKISLLSFVADVFTVGSTLAATIAAGIVTYVSWLEYKKARQECTETTPGTSSSQGFAQPGQGPNTTLLTDLIRREMRPQ